jgi:hypothetical protein
MEDRHKLRRELFKKQAYRLTGCDSYVLAEVCTDVLKASSFNAHYIDFVIVFSKFSKIPFWWT